MAHGRLIPRSGLSNGPGKSSGKASPMEKLYIALAVATALVAAVIFLQNMWAAWETPTLTILGGPKGNEYNELAARLSAQLRSLQTDEWRTPASNLGEVINDSIFDPDR